MTENKILSCVVIDDEEATRELLCGYVAKVPFLQLTESFSSPYKANSFLLTNTVDLIISDIELNEEINGLQMLSSLPYRPMIVFITAFREYAFDSYSLNSVDYLLKPVSMEQFMASMNKVYSRWASAAAPAAPYPAVNSDTGYIFVKVENHLQKIILSEIICIEADGDYVKIHLTGRRRILSLQSLNSIESRLNDNFMRVHRSWIVSMDKIEKIERQRIMIGEMIIPISTRYYRDFSDRINL